MHNLPKCKTCKYYETSVVTFTAGKQRSHACMSSKWKWTDADNEEWDKKHPVKHEFSVKNSMPEFVIERHCDYKFVDKSVEEFEIKKNTCKNCKLIGTVCLTAHPDEEICDYDFEPEDDLIDDEESW